MSNLMERNIVLLFVVVVSAIFLLYINGHWLVNHNDINTPPNTCIARKADNTYKMKHITKKPFIVLCIFSRNDDIENRQSIRNTWLSKMQEQKDTLPFIVTYKFILSFKTDEIIEENLINDDIVFLNTTPIRKGVIGGKMLYTLIKTIHATYENATIVRIDDDVFVCVPELFYRLAEIFSPTVYYGWKFGNPSIISRSAPIDEMFVVIGETLVKRILKRRFCDSDKCLPNELVMLYYGSNSLADWLKSYSDVNVIADNNRIIHFLGGLNYSAKLQQYKKYIDVDFCNKYVIFHKSSPEVMYQLSKLNAESSFRYVSNHIISKTNNEVNIEPATSGIVFTGTVIRPLLNPIHVNNKTQPVMVDRERHCSKWAVVTTIFTVSKAVEHIISLNDWCVVVVADEKTPDETQYFKHVTFQLNSNRVKYLSLKEQHINYPVLSEAIPVNSFSRKNMGYIYAIHNGADVIWDFDDDNYGIINNTQQKTSEYVTSCPNFKSKVLNPYPYFGVSDSRTWPRGFPLQEIKINNSIPQICNLSKQLKIGVIQSLANGQPDVDAIYRLTREVPLRFMADLESHRGLVIPHTSFSPFNGQATLWYKPAFRFMALPVSVNGRVSDIWRSYVAQYFMHQLGISLVFTPPYVVQERNAHTIIKDFNGELDLYQKSSPLIDLLCSLETTKRLTMQKLYDILYVRDYLDFTDLTFILAWENTFEYLKHFRKL